MQKLEERNTYTPTDIPHVRSNCDLSLNVEETLSVAGLKTSSNNSDAALTGFRKFQNNTCEYMLQKLLSIDKRIRLSVIVKTDNIYGSHPTVLAVGFRAWNGL